MFSVFSSKIKKILTKIVFFLEQSQFNPYRSMVQEPQQVAAAAFDALLANKPNGIIESHIQNFLGSNLCSF